MNERIKMTGTPLKSLFLVLNRNALRALAGQRIFDRGLRYYLDDRVELEIATQNHIRAFVMGSNMYEVDIQLQPDGRAYYSCDCPYEFFCKHIVATALAAETQQRTARHLPFAPRKRAVVRRLSEWESFVERIGPETRQEKGKWAVVFTLSTSPSDWTLLVERAYIRKDGALGRRASMSAWDLKYKDIIINEMEKFALAFAFSDFAETDRRTRYLLNSGSGKITNEMGARCGYLFSLLKNSNLHYKTKTGQPVSLAYSPEKGRLQFRARKKSSDILCRPYLIWDDVDEPISPDHIILTQGPIWVLRENTLIELEGINDASVLMPFTERDFNLRIPATDFVSFLQKIELKDDLVQNLELSPDIAIEEIEAAAVPRLYLSEQAGNLQIELRFAYDEAEVNGDYVSRYIYSATNGGQKARRIRRNMQREAECEQKLVESGVRKSQDGFFQLVKPDQAFQWLLEDISSLLEAGFEVYGEKDLQKYKVHRGTPQVQVSVTSGIDWFDLQLIVDFDGIMLSLAALRKALRENRSYVKLADGSFVRIPESWIRKFKHLLQIGEVEKDRIRLSQVHATMIDTLAAEADSVQGDFKYKEFIRKLKSFSGIGEAQPPAKLKGTLREYQRAGYQWLLFLQEYGFGGCLADDMGLGKTIQAISVLLHEKEKGVHKASLVVSPTSVVFNWQNELRRFAPSLRFHTQLGLERPRDVSQFDQYDVILSTYGTLRRDVVFMKDYPFHYIILDESQYIKNPNSQTAKSARLLQATHRLALTGTPVENNTLELWSQMAFLNPGMLGGQKYFQGTFATPIERKGDATAANFLHKLIYPFVLRRSKDQVEKDLPPKTETVIYANMVPAQEKLYNQWRDFYRAAILKEIDASGMNKSRMIVLEGLMKLRQIACHPVLVDQRAAKNAGKFDAFWEHLQEILSEGHKVLIFSQFVKMLNIMRERLDSESIVYEYLDGRTRDREARVKNFQENENIKLFLISLRAGGVGINLTAADYVIHYDPWWNPAVEMQASDRTHRIGQDKHVFVYKFITRKTVEEKVLELQQKKRKLVEQLISTDRTFFKKLTRQDIEVLFT